MNYYDIVPKKREQFLKPIIIEGSGNDAPEPFSVSDNERWEIDYGERV